MAVVSGGTTLIDNGALDAGVPTGSLILLSTQTASASASLEFSLDDSYDSYIFKFYNIHPATDNVNFNFNMSTDNGSNYNVTKTSTWFRAEHYENDSGAGLSYDTGRDLAQGTGDQTLAYRIGNDNDQTTSGELILYNPSSTTFVKHFIAKFNDVLNVDISQNSFIAGYGNTTSPINSIIFRMSSGNIDDGIIKMYGVK